MTAPATNERYKNHRFPGEIISHGVWLYYRFTLSYRDVEELLFERGITVSHEAVRQWCRKFGQDDANRLRRRRPRPGDKWHLDEVFLTMNGKRQYLWRAVDQDDHVLDILVPSRRNKKAAKKFEFIPICDRNSHGSSPWLPRSYPSVGCGSTISIAVSSAGAASQTEATSRRGASAIW